MTTFAYIREYDSAPLRVPNIYPGGVVPSRYGSKGENASVRATGTGEGVCGAPHRDTAVRGIVDTMKDVDTN